MIGIYKITNPKSAIYIGQTIDYKKRLTYYRNMYGKSQHKLFNSFKKYGFYNHIFEFIETCERPNLNKRERYWQEFYNCICPKKGLNCILVETDILKRTLHFEGRVKIGNARKGTKLSEITKSRISASNRKVREELSFIPQPISEETRSKMSNSTKKCPAKLNNLQLGRNVGYPVIQMTMEGEFIKEWKNAQEAATHLGINRSSISNNMLGKQKQAGHFKWKPKYQENVNNKSYIFLKSNENK